MKVPILLTRKARIFYLWTRMQLTKGPIDGDGGIYTYFLHSWVPCQIRGNPMLIFVVVSIEIGKKLLPWESNEVIMQSYTTKTGPAIIKYLAMNPRSCYFKFRSLEKVSGWLQVRAHQLSETFHLITQSFYIYLEEGSKLCIAVINRRTINAQTKFDLNTSSLIWEYCN